MATSSWHPLIGEVRDLLLAAIRAGMDPDLAVPETKKIQAELAQLTTMIANSAGSSDRPAPLTEADVRAALTG